MKTILIPLDGSELAERVLPYAQVLAWQGRARVVLVRVVLAGYSSPAREAAQQEMQEAKDELARVSTHLEERGVATKWLLLNDEPVWGIVTAAQEEHADLIVMSTHGRSGFGRWVYGGVAERLLHLAPAPILLVPSGATFNWPSTPSSLRIIVPLDGSQVAERALGPAADLAAASGGALVLVQAFSPPEFIPEEGVAHRTYDPVDAAEQIQHSLVPVVARLAERGVASATYVGEGRPEHVILDAARDHHAHLIAMATHGRSGLSRLLMGSVTDAVLRRTHVALLLVHPPRPAPRTEVHAAAVAGEAQAAGGALQPAETPVAILMTPIEIEATVAALEQFVETSAAETNATTAARELLTRLATARGR